MLILKTLTRGNLHGYAIAQLIQQASDEHNLIEEGSLYPALQRLTERMNRRTIVVCCSARQDYLQLRRKQLTQQKKRYEDSHWRLRA